MSMSVTSVSSSYVSMTEGVSGTGSAGSATGAASGSDSGCGGTGSASMSKGAQFLNQLQQLKQSDPDKLKQVLSDISSKLQDAAKQAIGTQADALNKLADKFQQAAQTGELSKLQPQHHGHHHHAVDAYQQNDGQTDPAQAVSGDASATSGATAPSGDSHSAGGGRHAMFQQVRSIISQVMSADLGTPAAATAAA
jgi:hypothetical protein